MLKLEKRHKKCLGNIGFLITSIDKDLYKSVPRSYIKRRLISYSLSKEYNLCGVPGFYREEDFKWCFSGTNGFFVPSFNDKGKIQGLSIHLDKKFNNSSDIWFSSNDKINGTSARSWVMRYNIREDSESVLLTDNFLLGNLIKETINAPIIAFQNINSYKILKEIEGTNIKNIIFVLKSEPNNKKLDYILEYIFRDLIPLGYNLDVKCVKSYKDFFEENFNVTYTLKEVA